MGRKGVNKRPRRNGARVQVISDWYHYSVQMQAGLYGGVSSLCEADFTFKLCERCLVRRLDMQSLLKTQIIFIYFVILTAKLQDLYSKGHPYPGYPGYVMMSNMNDSSYMNNGSLSPPMPRTVSDIFFFNAQSCVCALWTITLRKQTSAANIIIEVLNSKRFKKVKR